MTATRTQLLSTESSFICPPTVLHLSRMFPGAFPHSTYPYSTIVRYRYSRTIDQGCLCYTWLVCRPSREATGMLMLIRNLILPCPFSFESFLQNIALVTLKLQSSESSDQFEIIKLKVNMAQPENEWQQGPPNFTCRKQ